jgi:hypothetical protein
VLSKSHRARPPDDPAAGWKQGSREEVIEGWGTGKLGMMMQLWGRGSRVPDSGPKRTKPLLAKRLDSFWGPRIADSCL